MKQKPKSSANPKSRASTEPEIWLVSVTQLAYLFGVTERTINNWCRDKGCPKISHGRFNLKEVFDWYMESDMAADKVDDASSDIQAVKLEYWRWKTENEKMKAQQTKDQLIPRAEIAPAWAGRAMMVKHNLLMLATRIPPIVEGKTQTEMRAIVKRECETIIGQYMSVGRFCPGITRATNHIAQCKEE